MWRRKPNRVLESKKAVEESTNQLQKTEQRTAKVLEVSEALRTLRERNHFAEKLESIMGGPR